MSQKVLWDFFGKFGEVKHCRLILDQFGKSVGYEIICAAREWDFSNNISVSFFIDFKRFICVCRFRLFVTS